MKGLALTAWPAEPAQYSPEILGNTIVHDQDRIRQNINSLNHVSGQQDQVQKYAKQLGDLEIQLATLRDRQAELDRKKTTLQAELNSLIEKMEF